MFPARLASLFGFVLIAIPAAVQGVRLDVPRVEDFVRRWNVAATVIGDYVYIDGGEINQFENGTIDEAPVYQVNSTLSIDISTSWTTSDVSIRTIGKPNAPRNAPMIWTDKEGTGGFYSWGGVFSLGRSVTGSEMWKFSADGRGGGSWSLFQDFANPEAFKILLSPERGAYANTDDKGFLIGGSVWGWTQLGFTDTQAIPGMVSFDMRTKEISNGTANDAGSNRSPFETLIGARAHFIPANTGTKSHQGLILVLGGHRSYVDRQVSLEDSPGFDFRNLSFFDPETGERYWQIATGDIPPYPRAHFCVTGFAVAGVGYDVFIFGGRNEAQQSHYDDAYILSLPGFVWTLFPTPPAGPRFFHACVSMGNQVLSIGGVTDKIKSVDAAPQGLLLFDMTAQTWNDKYDAKAKNYVRAKSLDEWYQNGSMDKVVWSSEQVRALFVTDADAEPPGSAPSKLPDIPNGTEQADSRQDFSTTQTPVGAIAGAGAGGMLALAIIVSLVIWMIHHHKKAKKEKDKTTQWPLPLKHSSESPIMEMPIYEPEFDRLCGYWYPSGLANNTVRDSARMSVQRVEVSVDHDHWELPVAPKDHSVHGLRRVTRGVGMGIDHNNWDLQDRRSF